LAIAAISVPVQAEQLTLEEVVVTAQKRVESLQDVPICIVAVAAEIAKLARYTQGRLVIAMRQVRYRDRCC
jgi:hypothetical protein